MKRKILCTIEEKDLENLSEKEIKYFLEQSLSEEAFIIINKGLALLHGLEEAAFLSHLFTKRKQLRFSKKLPKDEIFYTEQKEVKDKISLSFFQQTRVIKSLKKKGLIKVERTGLPRRNYYKINDLHILKDFVYIDKET